MTRGEGGVKPVLPGFAALQPGAQVSINPGKARRAHTGLTVSARFAFDQPGGLLIRARSGGVTLHNSRCGQFSGR